jgi:ubiquinone/menaquinone biosynthesis C-methylase UbiE
MKAIKTYAAWALHYDDYNPTLSSWDVVGIEHRIVSSFLNELPPGQALDAAGGTGRWARYLHTHGWKVVLTDVSQEMLGQAVSNIFPNPSFIVCLARLEALPFGASQFDLVICSFALLHVPRIGLAIAEMERVCRSGGVIILTDIHPELQNEWGTDKEIIINNTKFPFPCHHGVERHYIDAASDVGLRLEGHINLTARIDSVARKAVMVLVFSKPLL